jgi:hypothetical protein
MLTFFKTKNIPNGCFLAKRLVIVSLNSSGTFQVPYSSVFFCFSVFLFFCFSVFLFFCFSGLGKSRYYSLSFKIQNQLLLLFLQLSHLYHQIFVIHFQSSDQSACSIFDRDNIGQSISDTLLHHPIGN